MVRYLVKHRDEFIFTFIRIYFVGADLVYDLINLQINCLS